MHDLAMIIIIRSFLKKLFYLFSVEDKKIKSELGALRMEVAFLLEERKKVWLAKEEQGLAEQREEKERGGKRKVKHR